VSVFVRLLQYARPYRSRISVGIVCTVLVIGLESVQPLVMRYVIDNILTEYVSSGTYIGDTFEAEKIDENVQTLSTLALALFGLYILRGFLNVINRYLLQKTGQDILLHLRTQVYDHLQHLSLRFFNNRSTGELMSRVTGDVESLQNTITDTVERVIVNVMTIIILGGIMISLSWELALITLAPLPLYAFMIRYYNRKIRPLYTVARERIAEISATLQDNLSGIRVIQCFAREEHELGRFRERCQAFWDVSLKVIKIRATYFPFARLVITLGPLMILLFGGRQVISGTLSIGTLFAFQNYLWRFYGPVESLTRINDTIVRASASAQRIFEILDTEPDIKDAENATSLGRIDGRIELNDVHFSYDENVDVLSGVSLLAEPGQLIGLVGPSGAGKTTIINLICRFYDPDDGSIRVDDQDLRDVTLHSLRSQIGMVLQDPFLFNGTIKENIAYGKLNAEDDAIIEAAIQANAHDFICSFPDAYDSRIGERGVRLSGGEKQRIAIARAILGDPRILILDEATSSVDTETEVQIQAALETLVQGRTTVAIAHRLSTVRKADRLYVIENGTVGESGTHAELLEAGGLYARLCDLQFALQDGDVDQGESG
jgi:ABC-type multidrug transport system fused ATPase/permease subunit